MKTRTDFVSNSSSSSFVLYKEDVAKGLALLRGLAASVEIPWDVEEEFNINVYPKNKDFREVSAILDDEYSANSLWNQPGSQNPDEVSYESISLRFSNDSLEKLTADVIGKIEKIEIYLSDGCSQKIILKLMYLFFEKNGCSPDAYETEQDFLAIDEKEKFMHALVFGPDKTSKRE